jgi:hypothetical protein
MTKDKLAMSFDLVRIRNNGSGDEAEVKLPEEN